MTLISIFYTFITFGFLFPMYIVTIIGKPLFLVRLINSVIHYVEPFKKFEVFNVICGVCALGAAYNYLIKYNMESAIKFELNSGNANVEPKVGLVFNYERNALIFVTSLAILLSIYKFTQRYLNINQYKKDLKAKKEQLDKLQPQKSAEEKKKD